MSSPIKINPVDFFNFHTQFKDIFKNDKLVHLKSDTEACYLNPKDLNDSINSPTFVLNANGTIDTLKENPFDIAQGSIISKFMLLTAIRYKGDYNAAMSYVLYFLMDAEVPYVRVGTDYYKSIPKKNRWGGTDTILKAWKKDSITEDHTKGIFRIIPKYDDFVIEPNNISYSRIQDLCYNLYAPFPHIPARDDVKPEKIPNSLAVLRHIFGDQFEMGLSYMQVLYQHPKQPLPVVVLVSEERGTGKTTFIDWIQMIFGETVVPVNPDNLTSQFNYIYATKNIIVIDETLVEKAAGVEKIKALSTAKVMSVNPKHVQGYTIPFFAKLIMCSNKVRDFMRIDHEENRYWIRYIKPVSGKKNTRIDEALFAEIPLFIKYLSQRAPVDMTRDRFVFLPSETRTAELDEVKHESKSGLHKELEILIDDFFSTSPLDSFHATPTDLKKEWFAHDHKVSRSYLIKVLKDEMKLKASKPTRYYPFGRKDSQTDHIGRFFCFKRDSENQPNFNPELQLSNNVETPFPD